MPTMMSDGWPNKNKLWQYFLEIALLFLLLPLNFNVLFISIYNIEIINRISHL